MPRIILILLFSLCSHSICSEELPLQKIKLPPGFSISLFAQQVTGARSMAWNGNDTFKNKKQSGGIIRKFCDGMVTGTIFVG